MNNQWHCDFIRCEYPTITMASGKSVKFAISEFPKVDYYFHEKCWDEFYTEALAMAGKKFSNEVDS